MADPAPRRRVQVRLRGIVQGVGFRPFVYKLAGDLGLAGYRAQLVRGAGGGGGRTGGDVRPVCRGDCFRGAAARLDPGKRRRGAAADRRGRLHDSREPGRDGRVRIDLAGRRDLRRLPGRYAWIRPTGGSAMHSRTAPTAGRDTRSFRTFRTTVRRRRWRSSGCARIASGNITTRPTGGFTRSRMPARCAARRSRPVPGRRAAGCGGRDPGDQGARRIPPGLRCAQRCGRAAIARTEAAERQAVRADGPRSRRGGSHLRGVEGGPAVAEQSAAADRPDAGSRSSGRHARRAIALWVSCCPTRRCIICYLWTRRTTRW